MDDAIQTITNITDGIKPIAPVLAGLVLVIIGLLWTFAKDPQMKEMYTGWMVNVAICFEFDYIAASLVSLFIGCVVGFYLNIVILIVRHIWIVNVSIVFSNVYIASSIVSWLGCRIVGF